MFTGLNQLKKYSSPRIFRTFGDPTNSIKLREVFDLLRYDGHLKPYLYSLPCSIQGVSRLQGITAGGDFLGLCDQKIHINMCPILDG